MDRFTQDQRFDHARDLRKHDFEPADRKEPPARLDVPLSTAMDIALLVRGMSNVEAAANLIEQYAQMVAAGARLDGAETTANRILAAIGTTT